MDNKDCRKCTTDCGEHECCKCDPCECENCDCCKCVEESGECCQTKSGECCEEKAESVGDEECSEVDEEDDSCDGSVGERECSEPDEEISSVDTESVEEEHVVDGHRELPTEMEGMADKLFMEVKENWPETELNMVNAFGLLRVAMETVETFKGLAGKQKKVLVVRVMHKALEEFVLNEMDNEPLKMFVDRMVDIVIDNFVDIDLGHLSINEDQKNRLKAKAKKICPCLFK